MKAPKNPPPDWIPKVVATVAVSNGVAAVVIAVVTREPFVLVHTALAPVWVVWTKIALRTNRILRETNDRLTQN